MNLFLFLTNDPYKMSKMRNCVLRPSSNGVLGDFLYGMHANIDVIKLALLLSLV